MLVNLKKSVLLIITIISLNSVFAISSAEQITKDYRPQDLLLKKGKLVLTIAPPGILKPNQIHEDLGLLRYALGHGWSPAWERPLEVNKVIAKIHSISQQNVEIAQESLCEMIGKAMFEVPDNHSYATIGKGRCGDQIFGVVADLGPNLCKDSNDPHTLTWRTFNDKKILVFASKSFPQFNQPIYNSMKANLANLLSQSEGFIIDIRGNTGGDNDPTFFIASLLWGKKPPEVKDRFQVQSPEALALYASRFNFNLMQNNTRLGSLNSISTIRDQYISDMNKSLKGRLDTLKYIEKNEFLDTLSTDFTVSKEKGYVHPIVILIDGAAGSAAEDLVGVLENHPNVTLVGQPTRGNTHFGNAGYLVLPNSKIQIWLSTSFSHFRDGRFIERIGFRPKVLVPNGTDALTFVESNWKKLFSFK